MDPDCAICSQPAVAQCECEAKGLEIAVRQAEQRMMTNVLNDIRTWVRSHAQDYILSYFSMLTTRRKDLHAAAMARLTNHAAYYYHARPHPSEIAAIDLELKRGIDDDWKQSVQRYPEVLEYFYGLVDLSLPADEDREVRDPPLSALGGGIEKGGRDRRVRVRESSEVEERRRRRRSLGRDVGRETPGMEVRRERERVRVVEPVGRVDSVPPPPMPPMGFDRERASRRYATPAPSMTGGYSYVQPGYIG